MLLVSGNGLERQYTGEPVFQNVDLELRAGDRVGLVGVNGAGKSTLLRVIIGTDMPDRGTVNARSGVRIGLLKQQPDYDPQTPLIEVARSGQKALLDLQAEAERAAQAIAEASDEAARLRATKVYDELQQRLAVDDAYALEYRLEEVLQGLGFRVEDHQRPAGTFSGGQQARLMLAKLLLESPDVLLLDEPTNHLDIATTRWVEDYLSRLRVAMVVVSHDRYFLDKVVTKIWELHRGRLVVYPGNYSQYWRLREERAEVLRRQRAKQDDFIEAQEAFIRKFGVGTRARQAQDRAKKLERVERVELMDDIQGPPMGFHEVDRSGDVVIEAREIAKGFDKPLFGPLTMSVLRGQCVGILGPNGAGKSTLLKTLIGEVRPDSGEVKLGHKVIVGYLDQGLESLDPSTSVVRAIWPDDDPSLVESEIRKTLGRFGLVGEMAIRPVGQLSGGERSKAALARLAIAGANLLIMDEPTNHLDLWSCEALERSIRQFDGTVLVVSHDRYFLNQVAQRVLAVGDGKTKLVEGNYDTYQELLDREVGASPNGSTSPGASRPGTKSAASGEASAKKSGKSKGQTKPRRKFPYRKAPDIEREIHEREAQLTELEERLGDPEIWKDFESAQQLQEIYDERKAELEQLYAHWEEALEYS